MNPVVSICCITYNHEPYIRDAIEGFLMQKTTFPIEILIFDDASTDGTQEIIKSYAENDPRIKTFLQKENQWSKGKYGLRDWLFPASKGKYIALCEGDDYWTDPYKLQKQVDFLEAHKDVFAVVTNSSVCDLNGKTIQKERLVIPKDNKEGRYSLYDFFERGNSYPSATLLFRNKNMTYILKESKRMANPFLGDWILWVLLHLQGDFYFLNQVTAAYRINPNSITHTVNAIERWKADFTIRKQLIEILPTEYHKFLKSNFNAYFKISMAYRKNGNIIKFSVFQAKAFLSSPNHYVKTYINILSSKINKKHNYRKY